MDLLKKITSKGFSSCILLLFSLPVFCQRNTEKGDRYFDQNIFDAAIKYYQLDVHSKNKKASEHAMQKLADCYRITGEFELAEETYRKILKRKKKDAVNYMNYGLSLKSSAKYAEAILQFQEYIKLKPEDPMGRVFLLSCDSAQVWLDETIGKEVKNLESLNTELSEFSPVLLNEDELFFSSSRQGSTRALISFDGGGDIHRLDLYAIKVYDIETKNKKTTITNFSDINTPLHEGSASFSDDGSEVYFTKTIKGKRDKETNAILGTLQVFYSKKDSSGKWSKPVSAFVFNSTDYSVGHPSLSKNGKTIFYMSDKPGGKGKTDIYYSVKQDNGVWGAPVNAGSEVNTFGHELFPLISAANTLYFSSDAHPGMGQLDVFGAALINGVWTNVHNLKPPINSIANDFGITFDGDSQHGFFSSDRFNGKGAEDIYSFSDETVLEVSLLNDSLVFKDTGVFDDVKYKLFNETDSIAVDFVKRNNVLCAPLKLNKTYQLKTTRYSMAHNCITLYVIKDAADTSVTVNISTSHKNLQITGSFYVSPKNPEKPVDKLKEKNNNNKLTLANGSFSELEISVNKAGCFSFRAFIEAGKQNTISSNDIVREIEKRKVSDTGRPDIK